ncbi:zinc finger protein 740 isoform X5 [Macaca fascicularis]|uniref:zinc finger protein 740 isoform X5 n=1 Tax=Macaca fascicularis TaxID=9541 RepID=UPI001E252F0B|nr:zinc finger protein 740 isoform X4 [Macaca fascicularis]
MAQASLLACEGLAGVSLVPTAASKKMMLSQIAGKQAENGERAGSPDVLRCSSQVVVVEQNGSFQVKIPKNFVCEHCFGAFRSSYHLKRHILIHTGEKPFECDICDMRFIQKYHLERHKRVHSGEKPYQCERCHQEQPKTGPKLANSCSRNKGIWGLLTCLLSSRSCSPSPSPITVFR